MTNTEGREVSNPSLYFIVKPSSISVRSTGNVHGKISHIRVLTIPMLYGILRVEKMEVDMSDVLVIEVRDSHKNPRCSVLWDWGEHETTYRALKLSYAIGSLNDDSTTEEIIENILKEFPNVGIPRDKEFYKCNDLYRKDYAIATKYADDFEIPDGNFEDGVIAITNNAISVFSQWADSLLYFELGNVNLENCVYAEWVEDFYFDEEVEEVKASAYVMTEEEFQKPITTPEQRDRLLGITTCHEWIRHGDEYSHVESY